MQFYRLHGVARLRPLLSVGVRRQWASRGDEVERHIAAYRAAPFDSNGEAWVKAAALEALEEFLPDGRVLDFYLGAILAPAEYDMARLHMLKLFEIDPAPAARQRGSGSERVWRSPCRARKTGRCWLGRAVAAYSDTRPCGPW